MSFALEADRVSAAVLILLIIVHTLTVAVQVSPGHECVSGWGTCHSDGRTGSRHQTPAVQQGGAITAQVRTHEVCCHLVRLVKSADENKSSNVTMRHLGN